MHKINLLKLIMWLKRYKGKL